MLLLDCGEELISKAVYFITHPKERPRVLDTSQYEHPNKETIPLFSYCSN